jgi:hypothetical protein
MRKIAVATVDAEWVMLEAEPLGQCVPRQSLGTRERENDAMFFCG